MVRVRRLLTMDSWRLQAVPLAAALATIEQQGAPAPRDGTNFAQAWQAIDEAISMRASQKYCVVFLSDGRPGGFMYIHVVCSCSPGMLVVRCLYRCRLVQRSKPGFKPFLHR